MAPEDKVRSGDTVPDPELSPTTNPILAQNLGLWAQVYYTTPPEQRDQAVQKLLEELKGESRQEERGGAEKATAEQVAPRTERKTIAETEQKATDFPQLRDAPVNETVEVRNLTIPPVKTTLQEQAPEILDDSLVCPACLHKNRLQQRFCGLCGFPLKSSQPTSGEPAAVKKSAPAPAPPPAQSFPLPRQVERSEESWDWLREKNTTAFDTSSEHSGTWKYIAAVAGALLLLLLASIWWAGSKSSPPPAQAPATEQTAPAAAPEPSQPAKPTQSATSQPSSQPPSAPEKTDTPIVQSPPEQSTKTPAAAANPARGGSSADDGTAELIQARRYLDGQGVPRDSRAASFWLWKAVAKKNTTSVLLLSDLYARGDGVSRSCDQARVLLSAAAQRGSTEAAAKLVSLRQTICP